VQERFAKRVASKNFVESREETMDISEDMENMEIMEIKTQELSRTIKKKKIEGCTYQN